MVLLHAKTERMREGKRDVGWGGMEEFHSDSECKLVVEDGGRRKPGNGGEREWWAVRN